MKISFEGNDMQTITREQLEKKQNSIKDLTLINTLPADKFKETKISNSINVPQQNDDFVDRVSAAVMNDKKAEIVVYCANKECDSSTRAARKLEQAGFKNVYDYEGGYKDWQQSHQNA